MKRFYILSFLLLCLLCTRARVWAQEAASSPRSIYELFLIGNSKQAYADPSFLTLMETHLNQAGKQSAVLFLGDNVEAGVWPDSTDKAWPEAQNSLMAQVEILQKFKGEIIFLPGKNDWDSGKKGGLESVRNQRKFIESTLDQKKIFLPGKGRSGPEEVHLTKDIVLILIDSHWWFHEHEKSYAGIVDEADFFVQIEDAISRNKDRKIIFAAFNPLYSVGNHGGHFAPADNLFPLRQINKALYLPLPGFLYTGYRKFLGGNEDLAHPRYKLLKEALLETFEGFSNIIYVAGQEHNLQYVNKDSLHHIISGAAGKSSFVAQNKTSGFASDQKGFGKLVFYSNGDVWLEFLSTTEDPAFRKMLYTKPLYIKKEFKRSLSEIDYSDSSVVAAPKGERYKAGKLKRVFFGDLYRDEWLIPVEVPVFDFNKEQGGLEIVKKGGGQQTKSLRLEDKKGQQWVLRSTEKDPSNGIPEAIKMQLAVDLVQDQMAAYLPWNALSVPRLADAAGIYHTNPKMVYLTKDPRLGAYQDDMWEGLYLFEERPDGNRKDVESFGRSKNIIGSPDMFEEITDDHDHRVDQAHFLKSRLMDVYIGDFDRHEDQWRWAGFKDGDQVVYRAVPRDRDQTFFLNEGIFPWISSRKFAMRMNQGFDYDIKDMGGVISQSRRLDRRFLTGLSEEDWIKAAREMQASLSDELITAAVHDMPPQITEAIGESTIAKLKARRDKLPEFAEAHYSILSKTVDVVGSDKREQFRVKRLNDTETEVKVWALSSKGNKKDKIFDRTFRRDETGEIRLYGLGGRDEIDVEGKVNHGMKVRIIGGPGKDDIKDKSEVRGPGKKTIIYDTKKKNDIDFGTEARDRTSNLPEKNKYTYEAFNYNKFLPLAYIGFNADEALVLGAGFIYTRQGFQKFPYASKHSVGARYATATSALELTYDGDFRSVIRRLDLKLHAVIRDPRYSRNFFGLGNETEKHTDDKDYNRVRIGQLGLMPELSRTFDKSTLSAGLFYYKYTIDSTENRYISDLPENGLSPEIFDTQDYAGVHVRYQLDTRNSVTLPSRGIYWNTHVSFHYDLDQTSKTYNRLNSDISLFLSFRKPYRTVIAFRAGGSINVGDYEFFQASTLGGDHNLRGYRSTRYSGDASFYQNTEFRFKLFDFSTYFARGEFGILGFNDIGRVWLEGEDSSVWHHGYGGGIWMSPFGMAVISVNYERSKDETKGLYTLRTSFLF